MVIMLDSVLFKPYFKKFMADVRYLLIVHGVKNTVVTKLTGNLNREFHLDRYIPVK